MWLRPPADADEGRERPGAPDPTPADGAPDPGEVLVVVGIEEAEREVLLTVGDLVLGLIASEPGPGRPSDPALLRLLPDVVADPAEAADLRRLSHGDVRRAKADQLRTLRRLVLVAAPEVAITRRDLPVVAAALTQLRLVLADRLGVVTDEDSAALDEVLAEGTADRDRTYLATVWRMLGALQSALVDRMLVDLDGSVAPDR